MTCERAFLAALDGNCKTPIAGGTGGVDWREPGSGGKSPEWCLCLHTPVKLEHPFLGGWGAMGGGIPKSFVSALETTSVFFILLVHGILLFQSAGHMHHTCRSPGSAVVLAARPPRLASRLIASRAGQAKVIDGELHLKGLVASPDGKQIFRTERTGKVPLGMQGG